MATSSIRLDENFLTHFVNDWQTPRSKDRDTAFRERTIRLVVGIGVLLSAITLFASVFIFHDPLTLVSYPSLWLVVLIVGLISALSVRRGHVMVAGCLLNLEWVIAGVGVVIMGRGYAETQGTTMLMLALVCSAVVMPRETILPTGFTLLVISGGLSLIAYHSGIISDPSNIGPLGGILINSVLFIAAALFLRERVRESDDRLTTMKRLISDGDKARQDADDANRAKSQFLANMSHELRTPLNAVTGYTDIMLTGMVGDLSDTQRELLTYIQNNGKRLLILINGLLDLSKIEAGKVEVFYTDASPQKVVSDVVDSMQSLAQKKNVYLKAAFEPGIPETLQCDVEKTQQIVTNLVGNALKFTDEGGVTVEVAANAQHWNIRVRDTGIGMPEGAETYIFEKFRQIDNAKTRAAAGTGLGLAIVKSLLDCLNGTIGVESKLGTGTVFTVSLPLYPLNADRRSEIERERAVNV
ncbi:MAG TPA: ATP-binding protein [Phototrophicaceae bacterium]|nr:ATP-binding protein [Phototrophicaceae bacterium]